MHLQQACGAVVAHAGHDDAVGVGSRAFGHGAEQHVHGGAVAVHQGAVEHFDVVLGTAAPQQHVLASRGDQRAAGDDAVVVFRFLDGDAAQAVQAAGKGSGEFFRHVLHDDDAGAHAGQGGEDFFQRLGAAGGGADGHHALGGLGHRAARAGRQDGVGGVFAERGRHRGRCRLPGQAPHVGARRGAHGGDQFVRALGQEALEAQPGFGHDGHRAGGERLHRGPGAFFREGGADHDGRGALGHDLAQEGDAVHAGHLDVQQDYVRPLVLHALHGQQRVGCRMQHLDAGSLAEQAGEYLAHDGGIVHDDDLDGFHGDGWLCCEALEGGRLRLPQCGRRDLAYPDRAAGDVEHHLPVAVAEKVFAADADAPPCQQLPCGMAVAGADGVHRGPGPGGKHVAAAEDLGFAFGDGHALAPQAAHHQLQRLVAIAAVQFAGPGGAAAVGQQEVRHGADAARGVPQRDRHAGAQHGAQPHGVVTHEVLPRLEEDVHGPERRRHVRLRTSWLAIDRGCDLHHGGIDAVQALRVADIEVPARPDERDHAGHHVALGVAVEVDHHVAQEHDVEAAQVGEPGVQVGVEEADLLAQLARHQQRSRLGPLALQAEAPQVGVGDLAGALLGVVAGAGLVQHARADVGAHHLEGLAATAVRQDHGDAVGLFAAGAGGAPHAERRGGAGLLRGTAQQLEMPRFAEEIGFVGGEQVDRHLHFGGILAALQQREVFRIPCHPGRVQALGQAPADEGFLRR